MDLVENIGVGKECTETGFGTKQDRPPAVFSTRKVGGIGITEDTSAQGDELAGKRLGSCRHISCSITLTALRLDSFQKILPS